MKCYKYGDKRRIQQKFDKDICFVKYGKPIKIYDFIQEGAEDCNIYKNLEKYGSIENVITKMSKLRPQIVADFEETMDLRSIEDKRIAINNIWEQLPIEEKAKFNNNFSDFVDNGYKHYTDEISKIKGHIEKANAAAKAAEQAAEQAAAKKEGGAKNGTEK